MLATLDTTLLFSLTNKTSQKLPSIFAFALLRKKLTWLEPKAKVKLSMPPCFRRKPTPPPTSIVAVLKIPISIFSTLLIFHIFLWILPWSTSKTQELSLMCIDLGLTITVLLVSKGNVWS